MNAYNPQLQTTPLDRHAPASTWLREAPGRTIQASIIVPVNAQADLGTVKNLLRDLNNYHGPYQLEVILVINNYAPDAPPVEIEGFRAAGYRVVDEPDARQPGKVVIVSARSLGACAACSNVSIHFDADCRLANPTALLNWYVDMLQKETAALAYSHVSFFELRPGLSIRAKIALHHLARFLKRNLARIPTTRGSNYAITTQRFLDLYRFGKISVDMQVGPAVKLTGGKIYYSGRKDHYVFTSGRRFRSGWGKIPRYMLKRLVYNIRSLSLLRDKQVPQFWNGFDLENARRSSFNTAPPEDGAKPMKLDSAINDKG